MPAWPATLPQAFLLGSYRSTRPNRTIRTPMDAGEDSVRKRYTAAVVPFSGAMHMTVAQRNAFVTFYDENEATRFTFPAQDGSDNLWTCRFREPPEEEWLVPRAHWRVSLSLELVPGGVIASGSGAFSSAFSSAFS